jgi:hypothetical protein
MEALGIALIILPLALAYISGIWYLIRYHSWNDAGKNINHRTEIYRKKLCEVLKNEK